MYMLLMILILPFVVDVQKRTPVCKIASSIQYPKNPPMSGFFRLWLQLYRRRIFYSCPHCRSFRRRRVENSRVTRWQHLGRHRVQRGRNAGVDDPEDQNDLEFAIKIPAHPHQCQHHQQAGGGNGHAKKRSRYSPENRSDDAHKQKAGAPNTRQRQHSDNIGKSHGSFPTRFKPGSVSDAGIQVSRIFTVMVSMSM